MTSLIPFIHHEVQEKGSMLCAQHALNCVLQGQYFDPTQLSEIATKLDALERIQMQQAEWEKRREDKSTLNMDDTGYFSLSVLEEALSVWGLTLIRWRSPAIKSLQSSPELQSSFVLNLENHWFTFRRFGARQDCWYNLNSFLSAPAWVGPRYLGALLDQAETEGYSVFTVASLEQDIPSEHAPTESDHQRLVLETPQIFLSTQADEMAISLGDQLTHSTSTSRSDPSSSLGLKSSIFEGLGMGNSLGGGGGLSSADTGSSGSSAGRARLGDEQEDTELQAALRASLLDADPRQSTSTKAKEKGRSRSQESSSDGQEIPEMDHHVDLIAPSKNRRKASSNAGPDSNPNYRSTTSRRKGKGSESTLGECSGSGSGAKSLDGEVDLNNHELPSASGGKRRGSSKLKNQDPQDGSFPSYRSNRKAAPSAPNQQRQASASTSLARGGGGSRDDAIALSDDDDDVVDDDQELEVANDHTVHRLRSPFLNPALRDQDAGVIDVDELDDYSENDRRGYQHDHHLHHHDVDFEEAEEHLRQDELEQIQAHARIGNRYYDDEDAELQAALAASMNDSAGYDPSSTFASNANGTNNSDDHIFKAWENYKSPPPDDVSKISRMREEARLKERQERERQERIKKGEVEQVSEKSESEEQEEEEEEEEEEEVSPEEIRRRRLARFGA